MGAATPGRLYTAGEFHEDSHQMKPVKIKISDIYVPAALRVPVDAAKVEALALDIADKGLLVPIMVRADKERYVLVAGLHRLEACKALGEATILAEVVQARKH